MGANRRKDENSPGDGGGRKALMLVIFMVTLSITCGSLLNGNGARAVWRRAGIPCEAGKCEHTSKGHNSTGDSSETVCPIAEAEMTSWLKMFQSAEMIFAFTGFLLDIVGPKLAFFCGQMLQVLSIVLLWKEWFFVSMAVCGTTTQLILNPCMCIGNLFSTYRNLAMAMLSGSADIAQFIFPIVYTVGTYVPSFQYTNFLIFWAFTCVIGGMLGLILLPMRPYPEDRSTGDGDAGVALLGDTESHESIASLSQLADSVSQASNLPSWQGSLYKQSTSSAFIAFTLIWSQLAIRLTGYLDSNEAILRGYGDDGSMGHIFGYLLPMSFIPCIFVGALSDSVGVVNTLSFLNICSIIVNCLSLIPVLWVQWVTIFFYVIFKSAQFSIMFSFIAEVFGFSHFGALTAMVSFVGGVANIAVGGLTLKWVSAHDGDWFWVTVVFLIIGVAGQGGVYYLQKNPPVSASKQKEYQVVLHSKRLTHVDAIVGSATVSTAPFVHESEANIARMSRSLYGSEEASVRKVV
eukprot:Lankesteria_metandrocarpae@DN4802_c0_g1_i4.p1